MPRRQHFYIGVLMSKSTIVACLITSHLPQTTRWVLHPSKTTMAARPLSFSDDSSLLHSEKSPESNFWRATPSTDSHLSRLPAIHQIDRETGPLPPGAYQTIEKDNGRGEPNVCLIAVKVRPPLTPSDGVDIWAEGVKNCQQMIDSGFNTFSVGNTVGEVKNSNIHMEKQRQTKTSTAEIQKLQDRYTRQTLQRHESEKQFYKKLRQNTPSSVLHSCHFAVDMEVPSILHVPDPILDKNKPAPSVSFGNGWMVRESISDALLRVKTDCLDTVTLEYKHNSPYHLDVLNTLCEMKVEGLIKSTSISNFPPSLLQSAMNCGFDIYANKSDGNLLNTRNLQRQLDSGSTRINHECRRVVSAPLAGDLLTKHFSGKEDIRQLTAPEKKLFNTCCRCPVGADTSEKWKHYREVMDSLLDISFKHKVSIESVALRWLLQLNSNNMISVGTKLGMDLLEAKGGLPYRRQSELRQVFGFNLEDEDMDKLCKIVNLSEGTDSKRFLGANQSRDFIDFNDRSLWL